MSCHCEPVFIGCFKHCKQVTTTPVRAQMTGTHKFTFKYNGSQYCMDVIGISGAPFIIPNRFIEIGRIRFEAQNPDGSMLTYNDSTCFEWQNQLGFEIVCNTETDLCQNTCEDLCE